MRFILKLTGDRRAATMVEYGLIATLVAIAALGAIQTSDRKAISAPDDGSRRAVPDMHRPDTAARPAGPAPQPLSR